MRRDPSYIDLPATAAVLTKGQERTPRGLRQTRVSGMPRDPNYLYAVRSLAVFEFHAGYVYVDDTVRCLSFADRKDDTRDHYFAISRSEESPELAVPDMRNVYIERDDQCWGGYGGIETVILDRDSLTLNLGQRMAIQMAAHDFIRVTFRIKDAEFRELRQVLGFILLGYELQLEVHEKRSSSNEKTVGFSVYETPTADGGR